MLFTCLIYDAFEEGQGVGQVFLIEKAGSAMHSAMHGFKCHIQSLGLVGTQHLQALVDGHLGIHVSV